MDTGRAFSKLQDIDEGNVKIDSEQLTTVDLEVKSEFPQATTEKSINKTTKRYLANLLAFFIIVLLVGSILAIFVQSSKKSSEICKEIGYSIKIMNGVARTLTDEQIISHLGTFGNFTWEVVDGYSFSCVDGRGSNPEIGTPGGDYSEFVLGLNVYFKLTNQSFTYERIFDLFQSFITKDVNKQRPFYYHTDDLHLNWALGNLSYPLNSDIPQYVDIAQQPLWIEQLTLPQNQGCSHVRLFMSKPDEYETPVNLSRMILKAFYDALWNIDEFDLFLAVAVHGPQTAVAFTDVDVTGNCISKVPLATPTVPNGGSSFIISSQAVETFRRDILSPFLSNFDPDYPIDPNVLFNAMMDLSAVQNAITVEHLAKHLPYYLVQINTP